MNQRPRERQSERQTSKQQDADTGRWTETEKEGISPITQTHADDARTGKQQDQGQTRSLTSFSGPGMAQCAREVLSRGMARVILSTRVLQPAAFINHGMCHCGPVLVSTVCMRLET